MNKIRFILLLLLFLAFFTYIPAVHAAPKEDSIYYIMVDRYVNGSGENDQETDIDDENAFHGGDLAGVITQLDKIKELGFDTINLSPIMQTQSYHGFLTEDYQQINTSFGTDTELKTLMDEAEKRDMNVILDVVLTHVSPTHDWVNADANYLRGTTSNQWGEELPVPNLNEAVVAQYYIETFKYWLNEYGIDGYRVYINDNISEDFLNLLKNEVSMQDEEAMLIFDGEVALEDEQKEYYHINDTIHEAANTIFSEPGQVLEPLFTSEELLTNDKDILFLDSHMTTRFAHEAIKKGHNPLTRWKLAWTYLATIPGVPMVYQGSEVPMDNGESEPDHRMAQLGNADEEMTSHFEQLAAINEEFEVMTTGDVEIVAHQNAMTLYKRVSEDEAIYIAINNDTTSNMISLTGLQEDVQLRGLLQDNIVRQQDDGSFRIALDRETADIFVVEEDEGFNWVFIGFIIVVLGTFVGSVIYLSRKNKSTAS